MQKSLCSVPRLHSHLPSAWHSLSFALCFRQSSAQSGNTTRQEPDYTNLIDPSSLRNTLDAVREANRARLIKKVDQDGTISHLQSSTISNANPKSHWLIDHSKLRQSSQRNDETPKDADADQGFSRFAIKRVKLPPLVRHLDHGGWVFPVQSEWQASKGLTQRWRLPWLSHKHLPELPTVLSARERLAEEIKAFSDYFTPNHEEKLACDAALDAIKHALSSVRPSCSIELIGSRASGLASPLSDLDMNLRAENGVRLDDVDDRVQALRILSKINRDLRGLRLSRELSLTSFRSKARVPIIAGVHNPTGLAFQMQHTVTGYNSTEYARAFVKEYPTLRALFIVLKHMLTMRGLCDGREGGLTSYPLLNMIVACLRLKTAHSDDQDVASHLLSFLDMYSEIDLSVVGISVSPPSYIPLSLARPSSGINTQLDFDETEIAEDAATGISVESSGVETDSFPTRGPTPIVRRTRNMMHLIDPADPSNNLGSGVYMIKHVQATLLEIRQTLRQIMDAWEQGTLAENQAGQEESLLGCMLEGDYKTFELDRATLQQGQNSRQKPGIFKQSRSDKSFADSMREWDI